MQGPPWAPSHCPLAQLWPLPSHSEPQKDAGLSRPPGVPSGADPGLLPTPPDPSGSDPNSTLSSPSGRSLVPACSGPRGQESTRAAGIRPSAAHSWLGRGRPCSLPEALHRVSRSQLLSPCILGWKARDPVP